VDEVTITLDGYFDNYLQIAIDYVLNSSEEYGFLIIGLNIAEPNHSQTLKIEKLKEKNQIRIYEETYLELRKWVEV
jgi:hypothetical protein